MESVTKNVEDAKRVRLAAALEDGVPIAEPEENGTKSGSPRKAEKILSADTNESDSPRA